MMIPQSQSRADRRLLSQQYPAAFSESGGGRMKKPLKAGIAQDLIQRGVIDLDGGYLSASRIHAAVHRYTVGPKYTFALVQGGPRYDLDGNPCGEVSARAQRRAAAKLMACGWEGFFDEDGAARDRPVGRAAA